MSALREAEASERSLATVVAFGGNLGGVEAVSLRFEQAIASISESWGPASISEKYVTAPIGPVADQPDYLNMVAAWWPRCRLAPKAALHLLQGLEDIHKRERGQAGGARTLDLDLLLHGTCEHLDSELHLPHPRMAERAFVLGPLRDLFGDDFIWPGVAACVGDLLSRPEISAQRVSRLDSLCPGRVEVDLYDA